jgi:hypothetical protein
MPCLSSCFKYLLTLDASYRRGYDDAVKREQVYPGHAKIAEHDQKKENGLDLRRLVFHSDQGATDLIALLSIGKAKDGGVSQWVSAVAIHNELLRQGRKVSPPPPYRKPTRQDTFVMVGRQDM